MQTKHDKKLQKILYMYLKHFLSDDEVIQQIRDAGFIHKSEIELDENKIIELLPGSSAIKGPFNKRNITISYQQHAGQDCIYGSIILEDVAHDIAEAKEKIIK